MEKKKNRNLDAIWIPYLTLDEQEELKILPDPSRRRTDIISSCYKRKQSENKKNPLNTRKNYTEEEIISLPDEGEYDENVLDKVEEINPAEKIILTDEDKFLLSEILRKKEEGKIEKINNYYWTGRELIEEAKKYESIEEIKKKNSKAYHSICGRGIVFTREAFKHFKKYNPHGKK